MPGAADPVSLVDSETPASVPGAPPLPPATPPTYVARSKVNKEQTLTWVRIGLAIATVVGLGGAFSWAKYSGSAVDVTSADIMRGDRFGAVRVHCDQLEPAWTETKNDRDTNIALCLMGDKVLPVSVNAQPPTGTGATVLEGDLVGLPSTERWVTEGYNVDEGLTDMRMDAYLDATRHRAAYAVIGLIVAILAGLGWMIYAFWRLNVRRTEKRMAARAARGMSGA
jgi:hypothetical protein